MFVRLGSPRVLAYGGIVVATLLLGGCVTNQVRSNTPRTATEQLLVSESAERAVDELPIPAVAGRTAAVRIVGLGPGQQYYDDLDYVAEALRVRLAAAGARIVPADHADLVVHLRAGTLGTAARDSTFGLPSIALLTVATPEIAFLKRVRQHGYTKLRMSTFDREGRLVAVSEPVFGTARYDVWNVFFLSFRSQDVYPDDKGLR